MPKYIIMKNITFFCLLLISTLSFAQLSNDDINKLIQNGSEQQLLVESSRLMQEDMFYQAEMVVDKLLTIKPESSNYNYRKGFLLLELKKDYSDAILYFNKAILKIDANYDAYGASEKSAPPDAYFHLATCYHLDENIENAKIFYNKFIATSRSGSELVQVSELRLIQCENAIQAMANKVDVQLKNVGNKINNEFPNYSPVISLDGSALYFTSKKPWENGESENSRDPFKYQYPEDVYVSYLSKDSIWMDPKRLDFCLPHRNEATCAVSTDERKLYLYQDSTGNGDIYYTDFYASKFSEIKKLPSSKINTEYWESHCMVSHDRSRMFFTSNRPGGMGGTDIYMSLRNADSSWSNPVNLGPRVNTIHDEDAPFVSVDNGMLYFSSNGEKSIGGFDIMVCDLLENGTWSESRNLGYPFNSTNDDIYYTTTLDGLRGYMTSWRENGFGEKDIYEVKNNFLGVKSIAVFKGTIKTLDNSPLPEDFAVNIKLTCDDCEEADKNRVIFPRLRDGMFMTGLKPCKTYTIAYYNASDNLVMYEETFTTECNLDYQEISRELILDVPNRAIIIPKDTIKDIIPIDVVSYKNLEFMFYFDYNKNKLYTDKGKLKDFVKEVEAQLKEGRPSITINVYSSASHVPTKAYSSNEKLATIRAENMKYDIATYFESKPEFVGKVNVVIVSAIVDGPEYVNDSAKQKKYKPYQFIGLKTE
jgi:tetratricopeptide (TPR) repeat protein